MFFTFTQTHFLICPSLEGLSLPLDCMNKSYYNLCRTGSYQILDLRIKLNFISTYLRIAYIPKCSCIIDLLGRFEPSPFSWICFLGQPTRNNMLYQEGGELESGCNSDMGTASERGSSLSTPISVTQ